MASDGANVLVNTFAADGSAAELPFHLIPPETVGDRRVGLLIRERQHDPGALGDRLRHRRLTRASRFSASHSDPDTTNSALA